MNDLPMNVRGFKEELSSADSANQTMNDKVEALEKTMIYDALAKMNGNQTKAGKLLGITERNLRYKMKKYEIKTGKE
jgi:transcriptional regulator with PAS, ATPase and Fis domain